MSISPGDLALERWGLRFTVPAVEADYRRWRVTNALPFTRIGMIASIVAWTGVLTAVYFGIPEGFVRAAAWILLLMMPLLMAAIAATYARGLRRWAMPLTGLANGVAGFLAVGLAMGLVGSPGVTAGAVTLVVYFGFTIFRMSPPLALLAVTPYVLLTVYLIVAAFLGGRLGRAEFTGYMLVPLTAMITGLVVCAALERIARETYRNERIIEHQQQALIEERANLSRFLSPEVTQMVRERGIEATLTQHTLAITAVCCDLRGFTAYTEQHGARLMATVLREYYATVVDVAKRYGATVKDFAGDGALILVGAPLSRPDHAQVGLDLARDLSRTVGSLTTRFSTTAAPLGVGVGIATGVCSVGAIGSQNRLEYTAVGAAVNLAARLCASATNGQVLISPATARVVERGASWREERMHFKGFDDAMTVTVELACRQTDVATET
ncbi:MAG: adenylate/guanylate cyclase domain-containing protein [bacterium]